MSRWLFSIRGAACCAMFDGKLWGRLCFPVLNWLTRLHDWPANRRFMRAAREQLRATERR